MKKIAVICLVLAAFLIFGCVQQAPQEQQPAGATTPNVSGGPQGTQYTITIKNFAFDPATLTVPRGTAVTWVNEDSAPHTITADGVLDSGTISSGGSFSHTFYESGTYDYSCSIHPGMHGTIIVE